MRFLLIVTAALVGGAWMLSGASGLRGAAGATSPAPVENRPAAQVSHSAGAVQLSRPAQQIAGLTTAAVELRGGRAVLKAMGKFLAEQPRTAIVSHALPGRVAEIHTGIGEAVKKGQSLVVLESAEVGEAKTEYYKAQAEHELAQLNLEREQRLVKSGIGLKKSLVAAEAEHKVSHVNLEAAEKRLHVLGFSEEQVKAIADSHEISPRITLYAPIAGKVVASKAILGGMTDPATEILTIMDLQFLWVDADVYEKDLAKVKVGQKVELAVPAYPSETFTGKVVYIGDLVNEETRTITVRTEVANEQGRLKPGMFADVSVLLNGSARMLTVPAAAILEVGEQQIVFVKKGDGFVRREIDTAILEGDRRQVLKGLAAGEEVVTQGNHQLKSLLEREVLEAAHTH